MRWKRLGLFLMVIILALIAGRFAGRLAGERDLRARHTQTVYDAEVAYSRGNYAYALRLFEPPAQDGNPAAEFFIGKMYDAGQGLPQSSAKAVEWTTRAANQNFAPAHYNLGTVYERGEGVPQNYGTAARWYRVASNQSLAAAQITLGALYMRGLGVRQDNVAAARWFLLAKMDSGPDDGNIVELASKGLSFLELSMTDEEIATAQQSAQQWLAAHRRAP